MINLTSGNSPIAAVTPVHAARPQSVSVVRSSKGFKSSKKIGKRLSTDHQVMLEGILTGKYDCMHHESFDESHADAERIIFEEAIEIPLPDTRWYHPVMDSNWDEQRHGHYNNQGTVVLTAKQEAALFLKFNYCRFRVNEYKEQILEQEKITGEVDVELADQLLDWHLKADVYRTQIADTNLALVLAMAKRSRMTDADFTEMVSEGNMALLRAIDKFDVSRGFKFSTYACRAIIKAFSRQGLKNAKYRSFFPSDFDPKFERSNWDETRRADHEQDCVDELKSIIDRNNAELSDIEQQVITHRFALDRVHEDNPRPMTLEQVGKLIGVTKERVRQIQNKALVKLKETMEDDFLV